MRYLKVLSLAAIAAAALMAFAGAGSASATELTCNGSMCVAGTTIAATSEGHATLDSIIGNIECNSEVEGTTNNTGSASETVTGTLSKLTFTGCTNSATVTVLVKGDLIIHTEETNNNGNGTLTSNGTEVTVEQSGFHCIFRTTNTDIGTVTGSGHTGGNATLDISANIPRTGGRSGVFCGSTAPWTGSYKITNPAALIVH